MTGLLAGFASEAAMREAAARLRAKGLAVETHAPRPGEEGTSLAPLAMLAGALVGVCGGFLLQVWATNWSWPIDIGGRPDLGWPAFVVMSFEMGMLLAVASGLVAFLMANRLPRLYRPIDEVPVFRRASRDLFFVALDRNAAAAREVLAPLRPPVLEEFEA